VSTSFRDSLDPEPIFGDKTTLSNYRLDLEAVV